MGAALVAVVDRARRRIRLDPQVRPGARLAYDGDAFLLHTTSLGHCDEVAHELAATLRQAGWRVTIVPVDEQPALVAAAYARGPSPATDLQALASQIGTAAARPGRAPDYGRSRYEPSVRGGYLVVCLTCGHATRGGRNVDSHRRNRRHQDFKRLPAADAPALQAQVRAAQAQASTLEDQETPPAASG